MANLSWYTNAEGTFRPGHGLGRRMHEGHIPFSRMRSLSSAMILPSIKVNARLDLPRQYISKYDQGAEGSCVGFAWSWAISILNRRFYAARKLYLEAQLRDPWSDTPPEEGTSVIAAAQVLQDEGHWRFARGITWPLAIAEGIKEFRVATTVDEVRTAIYLGVPVVLGIDWRANYDSPQWVDTGKGGKRWWIGLGDLGPVRGGHAICCFGARDDINAVTLVNNWGVNYPIVNMHYELLEQQLRAGADAVIPVDR